MATYRILSIDGGGIRGVLTSKLLERLENEINGRFFDRVDLFAGTSTGGLLALSLAAGKSPSETRKLYEEKGELVFEDSYLDDLRDLGNAVGAQYGNKGLKKALEDEFGDMTLGDLDKKVLVSTFDLDNESNDPKVRRTWKPKFFHNFDENDPDFNQKVVDVGIRTSAAPTFFPVYQGYVDGGVVANNPSMCAVAQALDEKTGKQNLGDIRLFSISTGGYPKYLTTQDGDWGWTQWARPIIDVMLEGNVGVADFQCGRLLGKNYHRLDPDLPHPIPLDDLEQIPWLLTLGEQTDISKTVDWLKRFFYQPSP